MCQNNTYAENQAATELHNSSGPVYKELCQMLVPNRPMSNEVALHPIPPKKLSR